MNKIFDSKQFIEVDRQKILSKKILKKIYQEFYQRFEINSLQQPVIELGSGGGFLKTIYPKVTTSDVVGDKKIDKVFSATKMPFKNSSIGAFVMLNTFHHIKNPKKALKEMERCLKPKGKVIMIEPYNSFLGRIYYQNFHSEGFDINAGWKIKGTGRMSDANNALPWIVFIRDRKIYEQIFTRLKITKIEPHTPLKFVLSGGLNRPQLVPTFVYPLINFIEAIISPLNKYLAFFVTIELVKNDKKNN